jgi:hypothetical protein
MLWRNCAVRGNLRSSPRNTPECPGDRRGKLDIDDGWIFIQSVVTSVGSLLYDTELSLK